MLVLRLFHVDGTPHHLARDLTKDIFGLYHLAFSSKGGDVVVVEGSCQVEDFDTIVLDAAMIKNRLAEGLNRSSGQVVGDIDDGRDCAFGNSEFGNGFHGRN